MIFQNEQLFTVQVAGPRENEPLLLDANVVDAGGGRRILTWTQGGKIEPCEENRTYISASSDYGRTWSSQKVLFQHPTKGIFTPEVFRDGEKIYAFPGAYYNHTAFSQNYQSYVSISRDGGRTFDAPHTLPGCIHSIHAKSFLRCGSRLIVAISWVELFGEDWAPTPAALEASGFSWWGRNNAEYVGVMISDDDGASWRVCGRIGRPKCSFTEPAIVQLSDGRLVLYIRNNRAHRIYESHSDDLGETWSEICETDVPSAIAKTILLSDRKGTIYMLLNPSETVRRCPLELWVSHDDLQSWSEKIVLFDSDEEDRKFCYPDGFIDEDRQMLCFTWDSRDGVWYSEYPLAAT